MTTTEPIATTTRTHLACDIDELRTLFLFEHLSDEQLLWLCSRGHVEHVDPGVLYREGDPATDFYVMLSGSLAMYRRVGADDVEIARTGQVGVYAGAWAAYLATGCRRRTRRRCASWNRPGTTSSPPPTSRPS